MPSPSTPRSSTRLASSGPAIGAVVITAVGIAACFYLNAVSFLAVIIALLAMRVGELHLVPRLPRERALTQVREGLRYARASPHVVTILIVMGALGAFGYNFTTLTPLVTKYILDAGATTLALLTTCMGIGAVVAGLFVAYRGRPTQRLLLVSAVLFVVMLAAMGLSQWIPVTAVLMFAMGVVGVLFMTTANTRLQLAVPGHMRGRIMGIYALLFVGTTPIGAYVMGQLAEVGGEATKQTTTIMVLIMAALCAIGVVAGIVYIRRNGAVDFVKAGKGPDDGLDMEDPAEPG